MSRRARILLSSALIALTFILLGAQAAGFVFNEVSQPESSGVTAIEIPEAPQKNGYWVCEKDGIVIIYDINNKQEPLEITNITLRSMRQNDANMFREGIFIETSEQLAALLEDFGS